MPSISAAVEGLVDEAVVRRIAQFVGLDVNAIYGRRGKDQLTKDLGAYNTLASEEHFLFLRDLDADAGCAAALVADLLPQPAALMLFRVAVREVETWLLGDPGTLGRHLRVAVAHLPQPSEALLRPKRRLVRACEHSSSKAVRVGMIPRHGSGRDEGDEYTSRMIDYVNYHWQIDKAILTCESLARCVRALKRL